MPTETPTIRIIHDHATPMAIMTLTPSEKPMAVIASTTETSKIEVGEQAEDEGRRTR